MSLDAQAIEFELTFRVQDFATATTVKHEIYDLIYRHSKAAGLVLASSRQASTVTVSPPQPAARARRPAAPRCGCSTRLRCSCR